MLPFRLLTRQGLNPYRPGAWALHLPSLSLKRTLLTLAIETSCDDTAVAILSQPRGGRAELLFNERITSDNREFKGVMPTRALEGHQESLARLVQRALSALPDARDGDEDGARVLNVAAAGAGARRGSARTRKQMPDIVAATRGPGIMPNLAVGLSLAKGLAVAWDVPLVGVHHMQAHLLTPRLARALEASSSSSPSPGPEFPFLSLLVSGGHTQLVHSTSLTEHRIVADTGDVAVGNALDQAARVILPPSLHLASRLCIALADDPSLLPPYPPPRVLVVAGGVASNRFLAHVLRTTLAARGLPGVDLVVPPVALCTDNAAMIAWAANEMYRAGWRTDLSVRPVARWAMDPAAAGAGLLGIDGWVRREGSE
ncbi:hypothetical protein HIM_01796 [Hirsutella minnesotensis 3608]|nr:hypothetical protein HIM_01796 [Hirsutella minnesotensis 3608]